MNLHRVSKEPDWANVPPEKRNIWQRIAARTHGIVTPANAVSVAGSLAVLWGAREFARGNQKRGIVAMTLGRAGDALDGIIAEKTGTKSRIGEALDATGDKIQALGAGALLAYEGVLPRPSAAIIGAQNAANMTFAGIAKVRHIPEYHPSAAGKYSVGALWSAVTAYSAAEMAHGAGHERTSQVLQVAGHVATAAYALLGTEATIDYARAALGPLPEAAPDAIV
ncbi:MAG TPA: CDP-alcohol phosphatidyltransferase family protein [Candidatus Saccharimonadales bacterium]|jgi:phosphatidylglycerophosphate synthase|nr:CDP-alcohol phosphatidyltransferase family protein [Candidatus Saccharimonadales bacterium]